MASLPTTAPSVNAIALSPVHAPLIGLAGSDGIVECIDLRAKRRIGSISPVIDAYVLNGGQEGISFHGDEQPVGEVTALSFGPDGLTLAAGTSEGDVLLYDLRKDKPIRHKVHNYGLPIRRIRFHRGAGSSSGGRGGSVEGDNDINANNNNGNAPCVLSSDPKVIKIWNASSGRDVTTIEGSADFHDFCIVPSGMRRSRSYGDGIDGTFISRGQKI